MARLRFAARDPGGANVLAGFLAQHGRALDYDLWTLPRATPVFERAGLASVEFPESFSEADVRARWKADPPAMLITGTSHYAAFEPLLWQLAADDGHPSLAVNDAWFNLPARFDRGRPGWVGAVHETQVGELAALGFPRERILVTGHAWLNALLKAAPSEKATPRAGNATTVLFVSEPIASDVAQGVNAPFGFDEFDAFKVLHDAAAESGRPVEIAVKFHPYEDPQAFLARMRDLPKVKNVAVRALPLTEKPHPWVLWADLVVGVSSLLLLEAIALGRPVISVQPGLKREDTFIATRLGYARTLTDSSAKEILSQMLADRAMRDAEHRKNIGFLKTLHADPNSEILRWIRAHA